MLLHQCVTVNVFQKISKASTTKEAYNILSAGYDNSGRIKKVKIQSLKRRYKLLAMTGWEMVVENFKGFRFLLMT